MAHYTDELNAKVTAGYCRSLREERDRLLAENERLRDELHTLTEERHHWRSRMGLKVESDIVQENERLRNRVGELESFVADQLCDRCRLLRNPAT